jgi:DNA-binding MarR family transcriptional regulator
VARAGAPGDGRGVLVILQPPGAAALAAAIPVHASAIRAVLLDRLSPAEQDLLTGVLSRIAG